MIGRHVLIYKKIKTCSKKVCDKNVYNNFENSFVFKKMIREYCDKCFLAIKVAVATKKPTLIPYIQSKKS